jgi:hypothetical protein
MRNYCASLLFAVWFLNVEVALGLFGRSSGGAKANGAVIAIACLSTQDV